MREEDVKFVEALDKWLMSGKKDKKQWDIMFIAVNECIQNLAKKEYRGVYNDKIFDRANKALIYMMIKIKDYPGFAEEMSDSLKNNNSRHLMSYCYYPMIKALRGKDVQKEDNEVSWEEMNGL